MRKKRFHQDPCQIKYTKMKYIGTVLLAVLAVGCGHHSAPTVDSSAQDRELPPVVVTIAQVECRPVQRRITAVGSLVGFEQFIITPKVEGRVKQLKYDVADRVKPQDILLELDDTDYVLAVAEAERALEQELAKLGLIAPPAPDFDIESQPMVVRANHLHTNARRRHDRQKSLVQANAATREDIEQTETELLVALATLKHVRLEIRTTLAAVRHKMAVLAQARQKLQDTKVFAPRFEPGELFGNTPIDYVVSRRLVSPGEMVRAFPSTPVYELVLDNVLKLRSMVPERHLSLVKIGQKVEVRVEAWPNEVFPAKVSRIDPTVNPINRTFMVEALVTNNDHRLKHGGFAKAEAILSENATAHTVPLEAIVTFAGVTKVFRVNEGLAQEVLVRIGTRGNGWVEVLGDLQPGDKVATSGHSQLANGRQTTIRDVTLQTASR